MGSAHRLTEANIWPKFNENLSKGSGDMVRTRKCYRRTDGQTEGQTKAISIIPSPLRGGGLTMSKEKQKIINGNLFLWNLLFSELPRSFLTDFLYQSTTVDWSLYLAPTASVRSHLSYHNPNQ